MTARMEDERSHPERYESPLRYPGGKAKLAPLVTLLLKANGITDGVYAEPFAGGASIALSLLFGEYASRIYINDIDDGVYSFWYSVLQSPDALCRLITDTPITPREWTRQREIYLRCETSDRLSLGFATFFLNRTNRSGIIASGGMIGGREQRGKWKVDARYPAAALVSRVMRVAEYRDRITLSNLDAVDFLRRVATSFPKKALVYLDPPYFVMGRQRLYANYYDTEDHQEIARELAELPVRWIVSYDNKAAIRRIYRGYRSREYQLHYAASERHHGAEIMFFHDQLVIPRNWRDALPKSGERCRASTVAARSQA